MAVDATGISNLPKQMLRDMLATCPAWLERLGRASTADGSDHIFFNEWTDESGNPTNNPYPLMIIATPEGAPLYEYQAGGSQIYLSAVNNALTLELRDRRRFPKNAADDSNDFENFASAIVQYIAEKSGQDGQLEVTAISWEKPPRTTAPTRRQKQEGTWKCAWALMWGMTG